jgi:hypothetical protein
MMTRGYRWVSTTVQPDPPEAKSADDSFIDPDTGMSCHDVGGGALCVPPQGTVHYQKSARPQLHAYRNRLGLLEPVEVIESATTGPEIVIANALRSHPMNFRQ